MARVLVIDDDITNRDLLFEVLRLQNHQVILAEDGLSGMHLFETEVPHLVITDIMMPHKDGITLIREIRKRAPEQKIIAVAAAGGLALEKAEQAGADITLAKPFHLQELLDKVQRLLST